MTGPCCPDQPVAVHAVSGLGLVFVYWLHLKSAV